MKIKRLIIRNYKQFKDLDLDLTNPETGRALDKVCFIGTNGTGKSTLLLLINAALWALGKNKFLKDSWLALNIEEDDKTDWYINLPQQKGFIKLIDQSELEKIHSNKITGDELEILIDKQTVPKFLQEYTSLRNNSYDLLAYSPAETLYNPAIEVKDVPETSLNDALKLFAEFEFGHLISNEKIKDFWKTLIFLEKKREKDFEEFRNLPNNQKKSREEVERNFDKNNPRILLKIAELWNKIIDKCGLYFDVEHAIHPVQLTENLKAYIKVKGTEKAIAYNELSTGIRNFIFRIGHIHSLYFNREITRGFLLVDEPENSLFPDFLFELMETYQEIVKDKNGENNTQMFFATHNPIVAAQFEPYERVILQFDENGYVKSRKGVTPIGDDPNDILFNDFGLKHVMGPEGIKKWERYLKLKQKLAALEGKNGKDELISEIITLGKEYNFPQ